MSIALVVSLDHLIRDHRASKNPWDWQSNDRDLVDLERFGARAREVEDAGIAGIFSADFLGINRASIERAPLSPYEPVTILAALAAATRRIGLIGTISTQFTEPYNTARHLASLTQLTRGRVGWNIVTSFNGEQNFGAEPLPDPHIRYERAEEFISVVRQLWDSWHPGYLAADSARRVQVDLDRVVDIKHQGKHFSVEQALDIPVAPYEHPVFFQAGASERGIDFAGAYAEAIFVATPDRDAAAAFGVRLGDAARARGRRREDIAVLPGLRIYIGDTDEAARHARNGAVADRDLIRHLQSLTYEFPAFAFDGLELDDEIPSELVPSVEAITASNRRQSRALLYRTAALRPGTTLREFLLDISLAFGHLDLVGTPEHVATEIAHWYTAGLSEGFTLIGSNSLDTVLHDVLPRLEAKGVFDPAARQDQSLRARLDAAHDR